MKNSPDHISQLVDEIYRKESRRVFATLIRLLGDFDLAEDAMHDAFKTALEQWDDKGIPSNPRAWLISTGRFKAIDRMRRQSKFDPLHAKQTRNIKADIADPSMQVDKKIEDDILRLIFTCCHPALSSDARAAMTLREVCNLTTEEIARAFLVKPPTLAQRIVRAKAKIREAKIPFQVPPEHELPDRLETVLQVIYLIFNEGYYASSGKTVTRLDLSREAIRLGRLLLDLLPDPEVVGLLALMLLHESRRPARTTPTGDLVLLEEQDRSLWDPDMIEEGLSLLKQAFTSNRIGPYVLQAAIAAAHAEAKSPDTTDWSQIVGLYSLLLRVNPSPVIELNRAVAIAMRDGPEAGLNEINTILDRGELSDYHLAHSAQAELCQKLGQTKEARASWERALALAQQNPERRFIKRKLNELGR
ncbi:RNA polymerase sigma factor [Fodinibius sediminis]|uniref:RNA polymerase sigma-70 factor, ECF subfamily n=1 Tax=Fodinibius sediminis TaxID=1214077 RepID=A0A521E883_9BACT|nr:RNA polymerase sigma factor [Fodinibius sediminis]SMO79380.1 RNA polymerase sigma-70 factor, ECF subfamily [Fodinibius sediminis]